MNRIHIQMTALAALLALAGCAKEIENTPEERDSAAIELSSVSTDPMTKAVITGTEFTTSEAQAGIGLFLLDNDGNAYGSNPANVKYYHSGSKWVADSPLRIGNTAGILYGYYPYSSTASDVKAIPVASSINGTDYLFGNIADLTSANAKTESLTLSHALARLRITFKLDNSFVGSGTLSSLTIEGDGIAASGTLDATSGKITATKSAFTVSGLNASLTTGLTEDCLVVPAATSNTPQAVTLKFTVDGKAYKVDLTDGLAVKLQSGIQTDITLTVKNTSVTVDGSSIGAWGDGGSQTITVGGDYTVTVKLAENTPASGVALHAYIEGDRVMLKAMRWDGYGLECIRDNEVLNPTTKDNGYFIYNLSFLSDITKDIVVTVGYITVNFDLNNSNITDNFKDKPADTKIGYNSTIAPTYASAERHSFRGWYKDANCKVPWKYSTDKVTKSLTLYAAWAEDPAGTQIDEHDFVKLGGYYWATQNVYMSSWGATKSDGKPAYGSYYIQHNSKDAARSWSDQWTVPSGAQWQALIDYCKWAWKTDYNYNGTKMNGYLVTGRDDTYESEHSIFLPAAGMSKSVDGSVSDYGTSGFYWSKDDGICLFFGPTFSKLSDHNSTNGMIVRPVLAK